MNLSWTKYSTYKKCLLQYHLRVACRLGFPKDAYVTRRREMIENKERCTECLAPASVIDHIIAMRLFTLVPEILGNRPNLRTNLQPMCQGHHNVKSVMDRKFIAEVKCESSQVSAN